MALASGRICRVHAVQRFSRGQRAAACRQPERGSIGCSESEFNQPIRGGFRHSEPKRDKPFCRRLSDPAACSRHRSEENEFSPALVDERVRVPPQRARKAQVAKRRAKSRGDGNEQMTRPFEALEGARRDRIEMEKRDAQEKAKEARLAREQKAKERGAKKRGAAQKPENDQGVSAPAGPMKSN